MATIEHEVITTDELRRRIDDLSREKLGLGVEEFARRYSERSLDLTSPAVSNLAMLARLLFASTGRSEP